MTSCELLYLKMIAEICLDNEAAICSLYVKNTTSAWLVNKQIFWNTTEKSGNVFLFWNSTMSLLLL
jgi:hypothetical protein